MYSLNAPVPGQLKRLAADLHPDLYGFDSVREEHTLVVKRFGRRTLPEFRELETAVRETLAGAPACEARVAEIDCFERPTSGPGPVVYLAVESPGLVAIHERLVEAFGAAEGIEGPDYVPHVTLARGGRGERRSPGSASGQRPRADLAAARRLADREFEPVTWVVDELHLFDATRGERASAFSLPA